MIDRAGKMISILHRKAQIYYTRVLKDYGISSAEYPVLFLLHKQEGLTQDEISAAILIDKSAVTRVLQSLSDKGLIERKKGSSDRRLNYIFLTDRGREIKEPIYDAIDHWNNILTAHMTDQERTDFLRLLSRSVENLKENL